MIDLSRAQPAESAIQSSLSKIYFELVPEGDNSSEDLTDWRTLEEEREDRMRVEAEDLRRRREEEAEKERLQRVVEEKLEKQRQEAEDLRQEVRNKGALIFGTSDFSLIVFLFLSLLK